ncbi:Mitochondrial glycoprotein family protein [Trifolium repens]|nr:Mitochondrial glycoprotein family protein [Trifolium repens]
MTRVGGAVRKGFKAVQDFELLKLFKSEINFELSSNHFQNAQRGSLGEFVVESDSPQHSKDVILRRKSDSGEEVALSAILGPPNYEKDFIFIRDVFMKVCIKKPTLSSILQFDCRAYQETDKSSDFEINNAYYLKSPTYLSSSIYRGPLFSDLDINLQKAFKEYLVEKGIGESLTNFLLHYLHTREQKQYVNWLKTGEAFLSKNGSLNQFSDTHSA